MLLRSNQFRSTQVIQMLPKHKIQVLVDMHKKRFWGFKDADLVVSTAFMLVNTPNRNRNFRKLQTDQPLV